MSPKFVKILSLEQKSQYGIHFATCFVTYIVVVKCDLACGIPYVVPPILSIPYPKFTYYSFVMVAQIDGLIYISAQKKNI